MKDFDALRDIWTGQAALPRLNYDEVLHQVKKNKSAFANKLLTETAIMGIVILFLTSIWAISSFALITSHVSMFILLGCSLYYVVTQLLDYKRISNTESYLEQPDKYIAYLKKYRSNRYILNTRNYTIYSILTGIAFALYFIEVFIAAPLWQTVAAISITFAWFVICALLMQSYKKKEQEKLGEMIAALEKLEKQFV
jgi:hypothetical protein